MYQEFLEKMEEFLFVEDIPRKADIIFIPGNGYPQNAEKAAELYKKGMAPRILPSGRYSVTKGAFSGVLAKQETYPGTFRTEWEFLKHVLVKNGVPKQAILQEDQATYTYENAIYSRKITDQMGLEIKTALLCCKACHARRALMYYQRLYPKTEILVCPSCVDGTDRETWKNSEAGVEEVTGELTRIIRQFTLMME